MKCIKSHHRQRSSQTSRIDLAGGDSHVDRVAETQGQSQMITVLEDLNLHVIVHNAWCMALLADYIFVVQKVICAHRNLLVYRLPI